MRALHAAAHGTARHFRTASELDTLISHRASELRFQRDHLANALRDDAAWSFTSPSGGLWLWLRLARVSGDALAACAASAGLAVLPGSALFADSAPGNYVRVPFTAPPATLSKAAALLKAAHANLT